MWKEKNFNLVDFSDLLKFLNERKLSGNEFKIVVIPAIGIYLPVYKLIYIDKECNDGNKN